MKPDLQMKVDKYFRQCVGIDVAKDYKFRSICGQ